MYRLVFYVPPSHLEAVKDAVFGAGAGQHQNYDRCAWQCQGQGQFRPLAGSSPFLGEIGQTRFLDEYKVEMICHDAAIKPAIAALLRAHPYEQPAYAAYKIATLDDL